MFGFAANQHSYAQGKIELFADLLDLATKSNRDLETLNRIAEYVTWAADQKSDGMASAVDLAFFLPMFRNKDVYELLHQRIPSELLASKRALLLDDTEMTSH